MDAAAKTSMVVDCALYAGGRRARSLALDELEDLRPGAGEFVWIGLHEPDAELLGLIQRRFHLHELAVEDARRAHQRPKLDQYGDSIFVVVRTATWNEQRSVVELGETHLFVGASYIISVRHGPSHSYSDVRTRCESTPQLLRTGPAYALYAILDFIVDHYFPVADALEDEADRLEERLFADDLDRDLSQWIYSLKGELNDFRRAVAPFLEVCNRLVRTDLALVPEDARPYFRDIHDHVIRVGETIDTLRELLSTALEANLALVSVRQNETMRKLAAWAAIIAVPTLLAGIYGMNFRYMPGLQWGFSFHVLGITMVAICAFLFWQFRRARWL